MGLGQRRGLCQLSRMLWCGFIANIMIKYVVQAQGREAETPGRSITTQELHMSRLDSPPNYKSFEIVSIDDGHDAMWREKDKP